MPTTAGGAAVKRNDRPTSAPRFVRCSTIGTPAARSAEWIGRVASDGAVDVHRVDADQGNAGLDEPIGRLLRQVRVRGVAVGVGPPVPIPPGREQDGAPGHVLVGQVRPFDHQPGNVHHPGQVEPAEVMAVGVPVERRVEVGAGVGHHVDAPDLELDAGCVALPGRRSAQVIGDHRPRQPRVGDRPVAERMAQIDDLGHQSSRRRAEMKASWGTSTLPMFFMRFLPSFCFSSSLRLRVMSPP